LSDRQLFYIFNIILILLKLFVRLLLSGGSFIAGAVLGILIQVYWGVPFWIPIPLLILALMGKRMYSAALLLGIEIALLSEIIH